MGLCPSPADAQPPTPRCRVAGRFIIVYISCCCRSRHHFGRSRQQVRRDSQGQIRSPKASLTPHCGSAAVISSCKVRCRGESGTTIQQFMMRLSSGLRRFRWAVFVVWLLLLVPALYLGMTQSSHLTGGGFEVAGSQSLYVQQELEEQFPDPGAS